MVQEEESYRDSISTVDQKGKRIWLFPKKPSGKFYNKRKILSYFFLAALFAGPFIKIAGEPLLLLNILERKFSIFGIVFHPQDLHIFALGMITLIVFVTLFTVVFGRLFCGWVCPQTIFMEMVFRRIEYWIEGDWKQQQHLKKAPWTRDKILKKGSKNLIFWFISFLIANTFLAYVIGYEELFSIIQAGPTEHLSGFIAIVVFTTVFYLVFSQFREQVCIAVCPYGRLQSVLLDRKSLVVVYDYIRGEKRAKFRKGEDRDEADKGDCIDCHQCVNVCPTGIDIRNGTQLECVNCTACIDACDHIMESVGLEKGLIRYDSIEGIETKKPFKIPVRAKAYAAVLVAMIGLLSFMLIGRTEVETTLLRTRGTLFQKLDDQTYSNIYDVLMMNKTSEPHEMELRILEGPGVLELIGDSLHLQSNTDLQSKFMIKINKKDVNGRHNELLIGVYSDGLLIDKLKTTFIGPAL